MENTIRYSYLDYAAYVFPHPPKSYWDEKPSSSCKWNDFNIYVHVPFCAQLCHFCHFEKRIVSRELIDIYIKSLFREIRNRSNIDDFDNASPRSIYFGGGTASILSSSRLLAILTELKSSFNLPSDIECTIECEPKTKRASELEKLLKSGFNRISIGIQSFDDSLLSNLNRRHSAADAIRMVNDAKAAGFTNIHIDLMYGLPGQTFENWAKTVESAIELKVQHISAYPLFVFSNEPLDQRLSNGKLPPLPQYIQVTKMRQYAEKMFHAAGYTAYTMTEYSLPDHQSNYIRSMWDGSDYMGLGPSALSRNNCTVWENTPFLTKYELSTRQNTLPIGRGKSLSPLQAFARDLSNGFFGLSVGIDHLEKRYSLSFDEHFGSVFSALIYEGLIERSGANINLTDQGRNYCMKVMRSFCGCDKSFGLSHLNPDLSIKVDLK